MSPGNLITTHTLTRIDVNFPVSLAFIDNERTDTEGKDEQHSGSDIRAAATAAGNAGGDESSDVSRRLTSSGVIQ